MNKYVFRRLLAGIVIVPVVASGWFILYAGLVALGATPTATASEVWSQSLVVGIIATLVFAIDAIKRKGN